MSVGRNSAIGQWFGAPAAQRQISTVYQFSKLKIKFSDPDCFSETVVVEINRLAYRTSNQTAEVADLSVSIGE